MLEGWHIRSRILATVLSTNELFFFLLHIFGQSPEELVCHRQALDVVLQITTGSLGFQGTQCREFTCQISGCWVTLTTEHQNFVMTYD